MKKIENIKNNLNNRKYLSVLSQSMYMPTEVKLNDLVNKYLKNQNIFVYGYIEDTQVEGIIVLDTTNTNNIVILNIAVNKRMQFKCIGSNLIDYSIEILNPKMIISETDDDAVGFYKKYGFKIISLGKKYGNCNRYECKYIR